MRRPALFLLGILVALGVALAVTLMVEFPGAHRPGADTPEALDPAIRVVEEPTEAFANFLHDCSRAILDGRDREIAGCFAREVSGGLFPERAAAEDEAGLGIRHHGWEPAAPEAGPVGRERLLASLEALLRHFESLEDMRIKVKASQAAADGASVSATIALSLLGRDAAGHREWLHGRAEVTAGPAGEGKWPLTGLRLTEIDSMVAPRDLFVDVARAAGLEATDPPVLEHPTLGLAAYGAATADVDGDGLLDIFSTGQDGNFLYRRNPDGSFTDIAATAFVKTLPYPATAALFADLDNDGDKDLFLSANGAPFVFDNRLIPDGQVGFRDVTAAAGVERPAAAFSIAAADIEGDGDVDLYVACYNDYGRIMPDSWESGRNGQPNLLFVNKGDGTFAEEAAARGVADSRWSYAAAFADVDGDGDQDLYVANDFGGGNALFVNEGGRFSDRAVEHGVFDAGYSMGVSFGDYDADGDLDLHVTRMSSTAGRRILARLDGGAFPDRQRLTDLAAGNALYNNLGDGLFRDVSSQAGPFPAGWAWGGGFIDINNDGYEDLHTPNGFLSGASMKDT